MTKPPDDLPVEPSITADVSAGIAELAVHLAHLYFERAGMFQGAAENAAAARNKSRAESLYQWAIEAAEATNVAGKDVLRPELDRLRADLDSLELSNSAGA